MTETLDARTESAGGADRAGSADRAGGAAVGVPPIESGDGGAATVQEDPASVAPAKKAARKRPAKKAAAKKAADGGSASKPRRQRRTTLFPAATFEDALELANAVYEVGAGQPVRRITLFDNLGKSPDSGASRQLITNSAKYGLTKGSYSSEFIELTEDGVQAVSEDTSAATKIRARFKLAIGSVEVFKSLYETYIGNRLPAQAVLVDKAKEVGIPEEDASECVETFTVNTKFVGVLRSISGAERLLSIDTVIDDFLPSGPSEASPRRATLSPRQPLARARSKSRMLATIQPASTSRRSAKKEASSAGTQICSWERLSSQRWLSSTCGSYAPTRSAMPA